MPQGLLVFPRISPACSDAVVVVVVAVVAAAAVAVAVGVVVVALVVVMVMCDWWCCFCASCNHLTTQLFFSMRLGAKNRQIGCVFYVFRNTRRNSP